MANVLVIDDDQDITRFLQEQLGEEGHAVTVAHQGDEGLARALEKAPDLIMLDVFLPDSTGFQICSQIRKNPSTQTVPIIMMTGAARFPNQKLLGLERGANEYISKPFDVIEVGDLVHKYIGGSAVVRRTLAHAPAIKCPIEPADDLTALSAYLEQSLAKMKAAQESSAHLVERFPEPVSMSNPAPEPAQPANDDILKISFMVPPEAPEAARPAAVSEEFAPTILASKERFVDFGMELYALATRLCSTHAEQYIADQLLRAGLSVGARLSESRTAETRSDFLQNLQSALKDLKETAHWLMITRKAGLLETLGKSDLEKTCQSLTTLLTDFVNAEKKRLAR